MNYLKNHFCLLKTHRYYLFKNKYRYQNYLFELKFENRNEINPNFHLFIWSGFKMHEFLPIKDQWVPKIVMIVIYNRNQEDWGREIKVKKNQRKWRARESRWEWSIDWPWLWEHSWKRALIEVSGWPKVTILRLWENCFPHFLLAVYASWKIL